MPRPPKVGEKKEGGFSVSATPTEKESVQVRARDLGFPSVGRYFLALHEAEQRLGLAVGINFAGERWFMATRYTAESLTAAVPEDITVDEAIRQRWEDRPQRKVAEAAGAYGQLADLPGGKEESPSKPGKFTAGASTHDKEKPAAARGKKKLAADAKTGTHGG